MLLNKDLYEYILYFCDDKTILNMLSVNKKFNNSEIFKRILEKKYPAFLKFKDEDMSWRQFFVSISFFVKKKYYDDQNNDLKSATLSKNLNLLKSYLDKNKNESITKYHLFNSVKSSVIEFLKEAFPITKYYVLNKLLQPVIENRYVTKYLLVRILTYYMLENKLIKNGGLKFDRLLLKYFGKELQGQKLRYDPYRLKNINFNVKNFNLTDLSEASDFLLRNHKVKIKDETISEFSYLSKFLVFQLEN
jgi:hypothetical protein